MHIFRPVSFHIAAFAGVRLRTAEMEIRAATCLGKDIAFYSNIEALLSLTQGFYT